MNQGAGGQAAGGQTGGGQAVQKQPDAQFFAAPSRNIGCMIYDSHAGCDVINRKWAPPPRPASCPADHGDWGRGLKVDHTGVAFTCAGDTVIDPSAPILDYGKSIQAGQMVCASTQIWIRCADNSTGHGFTIAQESYEIF